MTESDQPLLDRPIVLDLGAGSNLAEIAAILAFRPGHRVIVIDRGDDDSKFILEKSLQRGAASIAKRVESLSGIVISPDTLRLDQLEIIIPADYGDPQILQRRKAEEIIVLFPRLFDINTEEKLVAATHHLIPGGMIYIVTENAEKFRNIFQALQQVGIRFVSECTHSPEAGGISGAALLAAQNCLRIPLYSIHAGHSRTVYDMYGTKGVNGNGHD
jgi:NAD(P)-dependent dehydrogenase (short-subunit alcohol dehydrogenase family)